MSHAIVVWAVVTAGGVGQPPAVLTPDQFIQKLDRATGQVNSFDVGMRIDLREYKVEADGRRVETKSTSGYHRQVYQQQGARRRIEMFSFGDKGAKQRAAVIVYDGESMRSYYDGSNEGLIDVPKPVPLADGLDYLGFFRNATGEFELPESLRPRARSAKVDRDPVNPSLLRFTVDPIRAAKHSRLTDEYGYEITVDPDKNFFPVRIRATVVRKDATIVPQREMRVEAFHSLGGGVFVPQKVVTDFFTVEVQPSGKVFRTVTAELEVANSRWNEVTPEGEFKLGFPVGSRVIDMHRKTQFVSGSDDPGKNVKDLISAAVESAPLGSAKQLTPFVPTPWWKDWRWLTGSFSCLALVGCSAYVLNRRRKAHRHA